MDFAFRSLHIAVLVWATLFLVATELVIAQPSPAPSPMSPPTMPLIRESEFEIRLIEDDDGNLVEVPELTRREYLELLELQSRTKEQRDDVPRIAFGGPIEFDGTAEEEANFVSGVVTYRIIVPKRRDSDTASWVAVPLRLDGTFVDVGSVEHEPSESLILDKQDEGFVGWVFAEPGSEHTIRIKTRVPLQTAGVERVMALKLPNMTTKLKLAIAGPPIVARAGRSGDSLDARRLQDATLLEVENGGGNVDVSWVPQREAKPFLESNGTLGFHVLGHHVWSEARLRVRSRSDPIDSFVVHLPPGMELNARNEPGFVITPLPMGPQPERRSVLVRRLAGETSEPLEVRLEAVMPAIQAERARRVIQATGFEVEGARPQWGSVEVTVEGNWTLNWLPGSFVQRHALPESPRTQPLAARFLYHRQPFDLRVELRQREARIGVAATYLIAVGQQEARLEARLKYSTSGSRSEQIQWKLEGWSVVDVQPTSLLAMPHYLDDNSLLTVPLGSAPADFELVITGRRSLPPEDGSVQIPLPRPADVTLVPNSTIVVLADDNVELTPRLTDSRWLIQETQPPQIELPASDATPLSYREELSVDSPEPSLFVADKRARPRETTLAVRSTAEIRGDELFVNQIVSGTVAHQPLRRMALEIPAAILQSGTLTIGQDAEQIPLTPLPVDDSSEQEPAQVIQMTAELMAERIGALNIVLAYTLKLSDVMAAEGLRIPLVQPVVDRETRVTENVAQLTAEPLVVQLIDERWTLDKESLRDAAAPLQARAAGTLTDITFEISKREQQTDPTTTVHRAWIQTWLVGTDRQQRVCFQLETEQPTITLQLPPEARMQELQVVVNGQVQRAAAGSTERQITVARTNASSSGVSSVELWYLTDPTGDELTSRVSLPQVVGAPRIERVYWQFVVPRNRFVIWRTATLTAENDSSWGTWFRGTRGRLEQSALEDLLDVTHRDEVPPQTNQYLFSSTGSVRQASFATVGRAFLMMAISAATLVLVLPFLYLPLLRQPVAFLALALGILALAASFPESAALFGQAGALGVGLGLLAILLHRLLGRQEPTPPPRRGSVLVSADSQVSGVQLPYSEGSSRATTESAPAHMKMARAQGET